LITYLLTYFKTHI